MLPDRATIGRRAKDRLPELCAAIGADTPACERVSDPGFFDRCEADGRRFPMVVKGTFYDAYVVHGPEEARMRFHQIAAQWGYPVLVQPFVEGHEVNLAAVGDGTGRMVGAVSMRKRAVTDKGKAWAGITTHDPQLQDLAARLVAELRWSGPLEVEALRDAAGRLHLIEINPRFPAWTYLSAGVDRNLPVALLRLMAGEANVALAPHAAGVMFVRYAQEVIVGLDALEGVTMTGQSVPARPAAAPLFIPC
jgi:carbamoyl-phosphate synthase large subunit